MVFLSNRTLQSAKRRNSSLIQDTWGCAPLSCVKINVRCEFLLYQSLLPEVEVSPVPLIANSEPSRIAGIREHAFLTHKSEAFLSL